MFYYSMPALAAGFILDLMIGDPRWLYHPVCLIGNLIAFLEKILRKIFPKTNSGELAAGIVEVILVCLLSGGIPYLILKFLYGISVWAGFALETFWCYQLLATKSLKTESMKVYDRLKNGTLDEARYAVSMIVGRDTQSLTEEGVTKAAVETVAENSSDGIIAPMFYMAIGGVWLMFLYKGINTMDSMLGYKNDKYLYFGRCAAKLDDVANYIPARLSGWLMVASAAFVKMDVKMQRRSTAETEEITPAPTLHRQRQQWQVRWRYSLQAMLTISESFMRNQPSEMESALWRWRISDVPTVCFMQPRFWGL